MNLKEVESRHRGAFPEGRCALAFLNDTDAAIETLQPYFEHVKGRAQLRHLEVDEDFAPIRDDIRFKDMLASAKLRLGMSES